MAGLLSIPQLRLVRRMASQGPLAAVAAQLPRLAFVLYRSFAQPQGQIAVLGCIGFRSRHPGELFMRFSVSNNFHKPHITGA